MPGKYSRRNTNTNIRRYNAHTSGIMFDAGEMDAYDARRRLNEQISYDGRRRAYETFWQGQPLAERNRAERNALLGSPKNKKRIE